MAWQATAIRFVFFGPSHSSESAGQIFHHLTGLFPTSMSQQAPMPGHTLAFGIVDDLPMGVAVQPGRLELNISNEQDFGSSTITDIPSAFKKADRYMSAITAGRLIQRMGVVIEAEEQAQSDTAARALFQKHLAAFPIPAQAREAALQLNVRTPSTVVPGMEINRLCRWGAITKQLMQVAMGAQQASPTIVEVGHAATLFVDVNTPADRTSPFLPEQVLPMVGELAKEAIAILDNGYGQLL